MLKRCTQWRSGGEGAEREADDGFQSSFALRCTQFFLPSQRCLLLSRQNQQDMKMIEATPRN